MKYLWSVVAALVLTAAALFLYNQPLGGASLFRYVTVAVLAVAATAVFSEGTLRAWGLRIAAPVLILLGVWLVQTWPYAIVLLYLGVGLLAAVFAALVPTSSPRRASAGR